MARMHSRAKGKSGSTRPPRTENPEWVEMSSDEIKKKIVELVRQGSSTARIGMTLRDSYGVPSIRLATGLKINQILLEADIKMGIPEDIRNLIARAHNLRNHLVDNKKDLHSTRGLTYIESKIRRLGKYYSREGVLPPKWRYKPEEAAILLR
ncbi:MAG: 30S ribosomal protein S15 [Candidatus Kariarchaeaceae archaeon]